MRVCLYKLSAKDELLNTREDSPKSAVFIISSAQSRISHNQLSLAELEMGISLNPGRLERSRGKIITIQKASCRSLCK